MVSQLFHLACFLFPGGVVLSVARQCLPCHSHGMFPEGWCCWSVFFEAAWLFQRVGRAARVSLKQGRLPRAEGLGSLQQNGSRFQSTGQSFLWCFWAVGFLQGAGGAGQHFCRSIEAAIWATENPRGSSPGQPDLEGLPENVGRTIHGLAKFVLDFLGCGVSCRVLAVLGSCSVRVQHPLRAVTASWATENPRRFSPGQHDSKGLPENVGRSFHGLTKLVLAFLGLQAFSRGLAVFGAPLQGCSPSRGQAGQGWDSPCGGRLLAIVEGSPLGWQAAPGLVHA